MSSSRGARNFRRRSDFDGEDSANASQESKPKTKPKPSTPAPTRLSFADDEAADEGEGFGVSLRLASARRPEPPSSTSAHKLTSSKERRSTLNSAAKPSNLRSQSGEYTKEKLLELQKLARPLPGSGGIAKVSLPSSVSPTIDTPVPNSASAEPVVVLKGLIKPVSDVRAERSGSDEDEQGEDELPAIPDKATIEAAIRARRQRTQQQVAPDYMSLDVAKEKDRVSSDEDEEDVRERVGILAVGRKGVFEDATRSILPANVNPATGVFGDGNDEEDDEEERKWEEEQFRKGLGRRIDDTSVQRGITNAAPATISLAGNKPFTGHSVAVAPAGSASFAPQTIAQRGVASKAFFDNIGKLRETYELTLSSSVRSETQLSESLSEVTTLENSMEALDKKYKYLQELKEYIAVISDFLNDRSFFLEELEERMQKLHEDRAVAIFERRKADLMDEASEVEAAVNAALSVLSRGSGSSDVSAATVAAKVAADAIRDGSRLPQELDEFGRDIGLQKRMDIKRRAEKRKQRRDRSDSKRISSIRSSGISDMIEGEVSTDESDHEEAAYKSSCEQILETARQIFSEAAEEYSNLKIVKEKLESWKFSFLSAYCDAYAPLSVPALFAPFVRLELLNWDPLYDSKDFFDMEWHELLFDYGMQRKDVDSDPDDADTNLVPRLVEKLALPILHHEIEHCWDIFSTKQTSNAVLATGVIVTYVSASSTGLKDLFNVVGNRLTEAIAGLVVPVWGSVVIKCVPNAAQYSAYRFGVSVRLLRNICLWKDLLDREVLERLAFEDLLKGKILPHVKSIASNIHDAITRTERIVASLSGVLSGSDVRANKKLQPLVNFVTDLGHKLEKRHASGVSEEETRALARRLKNMLVVCNEHDKARAILRTFQLREAV